MGELMDQIHAGGPGVIPLDEVFRWIPGLREDLGRGARPIAACVAIANLAPRSIPVPHTRYGHLLFGVETSARAAQEDPVRHLASILGDAYGAPNLGSPCGDVPAAAVAAVLTAHGFVESAIRWIAETTVYRSRIAAMQSDTRVWEVPAAMRESALAPGCVGITARQEYVGVDFATYGERVCGTSPLWVVIPGVPFYVGDFARLFGSSWSSRMSYPGAEALAAILTQHCGAPRAPRILTVEE